MSRTLIAAVFLCAAFVSPWFFKNWLPENSGSLDPKQGLQKRPFVRVEKKPEATVPPLESKPRSVRKLNKAIQTPFETGNNAANAGRVNWNPKAEAIKARHQVRLKQELSKKHLRFGSPVFCRIFKQEKQFELWVKPDSKREFSLFKTYQITSFSGNLGPKRKTGDNQAPEGFYFVPADRLISDQRLNIGFDLGYPNQFDTHWKRDGSTGFVNSATGSRNSFVLSNTSMEEIFLIMANALDGGQRFVRIHSFPFRMNDHGLEKKLQSQPRNDFFWANLKEGYDFFETLRQPPNVTTSSQGKYSFSQTSPW